MTEPIRFKTASTAYTGDFLNQGAANTALVLPDWRGHRTDYAMRRGLEISDAHQCNVMISDLFGTAYRPKDYAGDAEHWISKALGNPVALRSVLAEYCAALCDALSIKPATLHVVGYCLGGALGFEMARADTQLAAVASVHGIPSTRAPITKLNSATRFIAIHGASDPIIGMNHVSAYQSEMTAAGVDWMSLALGHARHGFTDEDIDPLGHAQRFDAQASQRSLQALSSFLYAEVVA